MKAFTASQCNKLYELYSYMVDISMPDGKGGTCNVVAIVEDIKVLDELARDAATVVVDVLKQTGKALNPPQRKKPKARVIPMKRRTA